jgi:hypothetical protein
MKRDGWERFEALAALAQREPAPCPDVVADVRYRLAQRAMEYVSLAWVQRLAGACAAAAVLCAYFGWHAWAAVSDPAGGWFMSVVG